MISPLRPLFVAIASVALVAPLTAQVAATYTLGDPGCNGSPLTNPITLNDVNPVLQVASLPNEYAYPAMNNTAVAVQIVGFEIYTRTNTGLTESGHTGLCLDASGPGALAFTNPDANYIAEGSITVGATEGWYRTTVTPPLVLLPGEVCWFTVDAFSRIAPPQHTSTGGVAGPIANRYRRPTSPTAWTASVSVARQIFRLTCASDAPTVPFVTASNPPVLGQSFTLTLGGGLPLSAGFLVFSSNNTNWFGLGTPVDLTPFGAPNCSVHCSWDTVITLGLDAQGTASLTGTVPNIPSFNGVAFYNQGLVLAPGTNLLNLIVSNLGSGVFGN